MPMSIAKHYTADEFYELDIAEPCELINGQIVYMSPSPNIKRQQISGDVNGQIVNMSPSPNIRHQRISGRLSTYIRNYIGKNKGKCEVFEAPTDVKLNDDTIVVPDLFVACDPDNFDEQKYNGAPDWIIEIVSPNNSERDYKDKLLLYKSACVKEYWIIDPTNEKVIIYLFGQPNITEFHTFNDTMTVGLYKDSSEPLTICINDLI